MIRFRIWWRNRRTLRLLEETAPRVRDSIRLAEGALDGTENRRNVWTDADYLCAILATLTGDGPRAQRALAAGVKRGASTSVPRAIRRGKFSGRRQRK